MTLSSPEPRPAAIAVPSAAPTADSRQDPAMRSLYKMTRTAGVGLQDYAAVNVLAVVGLLLALASVLVLIFADVPALLLLPAAAIVLCLIAFVQIARSNGTQTGKLIAVAGVVIAVLIAGTNVYGRASLAARHRADENSIRGLVDRFAAAAAAGKAEDAYALFDTRFHENVKLETFARTLDLRMTKIFGGPKVSSIIVGDRLVFEPDANGVFFASTLIIVSTPGASPEGIPYRTEEPAEFREVDGEWKLHGIPNWFAVTAKPGAPGAGGAGQQPG